MDFHIVPLAHPPPVIQHDMTLTSRAGARHNAAAQLDEFTVDSYWNSEADAEARANFLWARQQHR